MLVNQKWRDDAWGSYFSVCDFNGERKLATSNLPASGDSIFTQKRHRTMAAF